MDSYLATLKEYISKKFKSNNEDIIDIHKAFSIHNIDIKPIIKNILDYPLDFPNHILLTPLGHKYNELEFFTANMDSSINSEYHVKSLF